MTRDYVRSSRPAKRKPASRGGNTGRKSSNTSSAPFPMVRALLALSLVIGFGVFLYQISGSSGETEEPVTTQNQTAAPIPIEQQRPAKEQFDYMQILQNKEVPVELPDGQVISDPSKDPQDPGSATKNAGNDTSPARTGKATGSAAKRTTPSRTAGNYHK